MRTSGGIFIPMIKPYKQLNDNWNADPNAPKPILTINHKTVHLEFYLNAFLYEQYDEGQKAILTFYNVYKISFNFMNDEGYFNGQYRYTNGVLPWGEFYEISTNWDKDFPDFNIIYLSTHIEKKEEYKHYIFFMKDNTFECIAKSHSIKLLTTKK